MSTISRGPSCRLLTVTNSHHAGKRNLFTLSLRDVWPVRSAAGATDRSEALSRGRALGPPQGPA